MARIRTIKPEFFTSEDIVDLEPFARLLYIALWCEADREGRLVWKPKTFKIRYFPADDIDINALCDALVTRGLVSLYGDGYAFIPTFSSHQHVNPRETNSQLPDPNVYMRVSDASSTREERDSNVQGGREGKERKGIRVENATRQKSKTSIPQDFSISESVRKWADEKGYDRLELHLANFIDSCKAKGYTYSDWDAAFRNAISKNWAKLPDKPRQLEPAADPAEIITLPDGRQMTRAQRDFVLRMSA